VIGRRDHVGVMLDHDEGVAAIHEAREHLDELGDVAEVEPGGRLVEDVERRLVARAGG
jgi:hypothetical protein